MKSIYSALLAIALLAFAGCGGSKTTALPATQNPPAFSAAAVNDYVKNLSQTANDYITAIKSKDAAQIATLTTKFNETLVKANSLAGSLKTDEVKKLQDWANSLIQQTREAATAATAAAAVPSK